MQLASELEDLEGHVSSASKCLVTSGSYVNEFTLESISQSLSEPMATINAGSYH